MRYKVLTTMTLFGLLIVPLARAQSSRAVEADIPFDFGVQNTVLPAGTYRLTFDLGTRSVTIRDLDQLSTDMFLEYHVRCGTQRVTAERKGTVGIQPLWQHVFPVADLASPRHKSRP